MQKVKERFREESWRTEKVYPMSKVLQGKQRKNGALVTLEEIRAEGFPEIIRGANSHTQEFG